MDTDIIALESLFVARDALTVAKETADWTFWMTIGTWVSGIATFFAIVTSLYIASRKPVAHVEASMHVGRYIYDGINLLGEFYYVTNLGMLPIMISSIHWEFGKQTHKFIHFNHSMSSLLPKKVEHGEKAAFFLPFNDKSEWERNLKRFIEENQVDVNKIKVYVTLATGKRIKFKIKSEILDGIKKAN
ncbi:hypothetical protein I5T97_19595 [Serratia marcescens]|nr:hypothetical protein [Serratia marcescens]